MDILTYDEYIALGFSAATEETFTGLQMIAANLIDAQSFGVIEKEGLLNDEYWGNKLKSAVAMQVEFLARNYGTLAEIEKKALQGPINSESESVGGYSHSVSYGSNRKAVGLSVVKGIPMNPYVEFIIAPVVAMGRRL